MTSDSNPEVKAYRLGLHEGVIIERQRIVDWLRSLDAEGGDINRFLPTTLSNWIEERMHEL
jgi:hypothetical protein